MIYREFSSSERLRPYVKCFYICEYDADIVQDKAFATGCMELMFNLGDGRFQTGRENSFQTNPRAELWGQIIKPLSFKSLGKNKMLGIRFYPHTAAMFLNDHVHHFNDQVTDFESVAGTEARQLYEQLLNTTALNGQLALLESFLWKKVKAFQKKVSKFQVVDRVIAEMNHQDFFDNIHDVASRYGISSRYLQKLFLEFTGITPKLYHKINRFQKGLVLTGHKQQSLTSIAYLSGYFDQSHFVRDFKLFTGISPSNFDAGSSSAILASPNKF